MEYYPGYLRATSKFGTGENGHGLSYRRYEATATIGNDDYLTTRGVSFGNSPFILGPWNPQRGATASSFSEPTAASILMEDSDTPVALQNVDEEIPIDNLTSYGMVHQTGNVYTLTENETFDSGISIEIEVPLGAYAVSFLYQFQDGDEADRLVASAGEDTAQFIVPNLPLYRTQPFEGMIDVASLGQSTVTLDFCLDGVGAANSMVTISDIKFLISDDIDNDGIPNEMELALGTDPMNPDTDGDGLSDYEELYIYFTDPTNPDSDFDGVSDYFEVMAGTDPNSADSTFRITELDPIENGDVHIEFQGGDGRTFRVRGSETPYGKTNWVIGTGLRAVDGIITVVDPGRRLSSERFFYWAEVESID
jgi:hypothetical protein